MKNTYLRIGNYLQRVDGSIVSVKRLIKDDDDILVNETQGLFTLGYTALPIPLTEEILLKCGFEKTYYGYKYYGENVLHFVLRNNNIYLGYFDDDDWCRIGKPIKYLHQLQNVINALTGQELKIEL